MCFFWCHTSRLESGAILVNGLRLFGVRKLTCGDVSCSLQVEAQEHDAVACKGEMTNYMEPSPHWCVSEEPTFEGT